MRPPRPRLLGMLDHAGQFPGDIAPLRFAQHGGRDLAEPLRRADRIVDPPLLEQQEHAPRPRRDRPVVVLHVRQQLGVLPDRVVRTIQALEPLPPGQPERDRKVRVEVRRRQILRRQRHALLRGQLHRPLDGDDPKLPVLVPTPRQSFGGFEQLAYQRRVGAFVPGEPGHQPPQMPRRVGGRRMMQERRREQRQALPPPARVGAAIGGPRRLVRRGLRSGRRALRQKGGLLLEQQPLHLCVHGPPRALAFDQRLQRPRHRVEQRGLLRFERRGQRRDPLRADPVRLRVLDDVVDHVLLSPVAGGHDSVERARGQIPVRRVVGDDQQQLRAVDPMPALHVERGHEMATGRRRVRGHDQLGQTQRRPAAPLRMNPLSLHDRAIQLGRALRVVQIPVSHRLHVAAPGQRCRQHARGRLRGLRVVLERVFRPPPNQGEIADLNAGVEHGLRVVGVIPDRLFERRLRLRFGRVGRRIQLRHELKLARAGGQHRQRRRGQRGRLARLRPRKIPDLRRDLRPVDEPPHQGLDRLLLRDRSHPRGHADLDLQADAALGGIRAPARRDFRAVGVPRQRRGQRTRRDRVGQRDPEFERPLPPPQVPRSATGGRVERVGDLLAIDGERGRDRASRRVRGDRDEDVQRAAPTVLRKRDVGQARGADVPGHDALGDVPPRALAGRLEPRQAAGPSGSGHRHAHTSGQGAAVGRRQID